MNRDDERRLILGLLSGRDPGVVRERSLRSALDALRRENRRRRLVRITPLLCAPLLLVLGLLLLPDRQSAHLTPPVRAPRAATQRVASFAPAIEPIDDQQLLALLAGRTVALVGPPGRERLLVFDAPDQGH